MSRRKAPVAAPVRRYEITEVCVAGFLQVATEITRVVELAEGEPLPPNARLIEENAAQA